MEEEWLDNEPYSELGKLLDILARHQNVRGPYNIARYVEKVIGYDVSGQAVSKYLYGRSSPKQEFIEAFADAFGLTPQERSELAWVYTYGFKPYGQDSPPRPRRAYYVHGNKDGNGGDIGN